MKRIIKYWKNRVEIFEEKAFMPLTLDKALKGDEKSLEISVLRDTHCKDDGGRAILFFDPGRLPKNRDEYDKKSMVRSFWYTLHSVLEDDEVQRKGCVIIGHRSMLHQNQILNWKNASRSPAWFYTDPYWRNSYLPPTVVF